MCIQSSQLYGVNNLSKRISKTIILVKEIIPGYCEKIKQRWQIVHSYLFNVYGTAPLPSRSKPRSCGLS